MIDDSRIENKRVAKAVHLLLKEKNPETKLGQVYNLLARVHGFRDWNTASALGAKFDHCVIEKIRGYERAFVELNAHCKNIDSISYLSKGKK